MWKELKPAAWRNSLQTLFSCRGLGLKCLSWCRGQKSLLSVLHYFTDWNGFFRAKAFCLCWDLEKLSRTTEGLLNKEVLLSWTQGVHSDGWRVKQERIKLFNSRDLLGLRLSPSSFFICRTCALVLFLFAQRGAWLQQNCTGVEINSPQTSSRRVSVVPWPSAIF